MKLFGIFLFLVPAVMCSPSSTANSIFADQSSQSGITTGLQNSSTPAKHLIETMVGGVAIFDYDNDGYPDIYLPNGAEQPSLKKKGPQYSNRLYRNRGDWTFEDVTEKAGLKGKGYDIAAAAADFNNDGNEDLFVAGVNGNLLFRNRGNGTFQDVTLQAGLAGGKWSVGAAWFDYDNDGLLDLLVVNYVNWNPSTEPFCGNPKQNLRTYCHPRFYEPLTNDLYRNNGDGTFTNVSIAAGLGSLRGKGMGVAIGDYDHDGWMDAIVTNDTLPNFLLHNERHGRFKEVGLEAGVALNDDGKAISAMGVDFRDLDNDGAEDVVITALANETFPYFRNLRTGLFSDITYPSRIGAASLLLNGWGIGSFDFNNDGWKDLFTANGDVQTDDETSSTRNSRQRNLLLINDRKGNFRAELIGAPALHRGAAFGDLDRDGHIDAVVTRLGEPPVVLRNVSRDNHHWVNLKLIGHRSNRDAIGARVEIRSPGLMQVNRVTGAIGYASSSDLTVHFGLGGCTKADAEIEWPSGQRQILTNIPIDRFVTVQEP